MDRPRLARPGEFAEAMRFTDMVFRPGQNGRLIVQRQYPHAYRDTPEYERRLLLVRDEGQVVGCLAIHPMTIRVEEARLTTGGIGIVGTHPRRRGEGIMSAMLDDAIRRMERSGFALSVLGGDRQRYGWFGWEDGGAKNTFELTTRLLGAPSPTEAALQLQRFSPSTTSAALCRRLRRLTSSRPYWVERPLVDVAPLFDRRDRETWVCEAGGRLAYVTCGGPDRQPRPYQRIDEIGGDGELALGMVRNLMRRYRLDRLTATTGPNPDEVSLVQPFSSNWRRTCDCMIKIIDLATLVEQLRALLLKRARRARVGGTFQLEMTDSKQLALLKLGRGPQHRLAMPDRSFVHLFFGMLPLAESLAATASPSSAAASCRPAVGGRVALRKLADILPLPFYIPPLNHI
ncbi:MAG: GNAT family N-acetyltransferase [Candidatus Latescibacterota bacterium]|nr:GNAT family N-acetyltransferase [Candidatus Latescibacterota bacterium]